MAELKYVDLWTGYTEMHKMLGGLGLGGLAIGGVETILASGKPRSCCELNLC